MDLDKLLQHIRRQFNSSNNNDVLTSPQAVAIGQQLASFAPDERVLQILTTCSGAIRCACLESLDGTTQDLQFLVDWCISLQNTEEGACFRAFAMYCATQNPSSIYSVWEQAAPHRAQLTQEVIRAAFSVPNASLTEITAGLGPLMACCCCSTEHKSSALQLLHQQIWQFFDSIDGENETELLDHWLGWEWTLHDYCSSNGDVDWLLELLYLSGAPSDRMLKTLSQSLQEYPQHHHRPILQACLQLSPMSVPVSTEAVWKLCAQCLTTPISQCRSGLLQLVRAATSSTHDALPLYWLQTTAALSRSYDGECGQVAQEVLQDKAVSLSTTDLANFLGYSVDRLTAAKGWNPLSQMAALLIAMAAWDSGEPKYLENQLLPTYPQLGNLLVPLLLRRLHHQPSLPTLGLLLCSPIVSHPVAAQQVWSAIAGWWEQSSSLSVVVLRRLPQMIQQNSRLYRRCMEQIGNSLQESRDLEVRLAAAASLAECAELDVIRDVADGVIGWVQSLLSPSEEPVLVHYAILTLHYLVVEEELDFNVVVTVLQKKLSSLDIVALRKLPDLILEAIAVLLGDGDCGDEDEQVPLQVSTAIRALVSMGQQLDFRPDDDQNRRVHESIVNSLSNYPLHAMGADSASIGETVSAEPKENSYTELRDFVLMSLDRSSGSETVATLSSQILLLEEEVLGASLWQRRRHEKVEWTGTQSRLPQQEAVREIVMREPTIPIAVLAFADGKQLSVLRDNADACLDSASDPQTKVLCLEAFLAFSKSVVSAQDSLNDAINEVKSWYELFLSPDAMYLALSSMSVHVESEEPEGIALLQSIHDSVTEAFEKDDFESPDIGKLCFGLLGISSFRYASIEQIQALVASLENTVEGYGGEQTFGAYYGLGLIGKSCLLYLQGKSCSVEKSDIEALVYRINGFLLEQLLSCFEEKGNAVANLIDCVKTGKVSAELVNDLQKLESSSIPILMTKHVVARYLFISLSASCGSLAHLNGHLMMLVFRFLESLEWGTGKGLVIPAIVRACQLSGVLGSEVLEQVYVDFVAVFEHCFGSSREDCDALEDIAYAVIGLSWVVPQEKRFRLPSLPDLFNDDARTALLVSSVSTSFSFPVSGQFPHQHTAKIASNATEVDIGSIVAELTSGAQDGDESVEKYSSTARILLSLLSGITDDGDTDGSDTETLVVANGKAPDGELKGGNSNAPVDFQALSAPHEGTLARGILRRLETALQNLGDNDSQSRAVGKCTPFLQCLGAISVPDKYVQGFIKPLLDLDASPKLGLMEFLCSQVTTRRRAFSPGPSFVTLVCKICCSSQEEWRNWEEMSRKTFLACLGEFGTRIPIKVFGVCMEELWNHCKSAPPDFFVLYLKSVTRLLASNAISPKSLSILRTFVLKTVSSDAFSLPLVDFVKEADADSILRVLTSCLVEIPVQAMDQCSFSRLETSGVLLTEANKALALVELVHTQYFDAEKSVREISNVKTFLSIAVLKHPEKSQLIRRLFCRYCPVAAKSGGSLDILFELLLLADAPACSVGLEWISTFTACLALKSESRRQLSISYLAGDAGVSKAHTLPDAELRRFILLQVETFPEALLLYCEENRCFSVVVNHLLRIRERWIELGVPETLLETVNKAIMKCQREKDASYTRLVASRLEK